MKFYHLPFYKDFQRYQHPFFSFFNFHALVQVPGLKKANCNLCRAQALAIRTTDKTVYKPVCVGNNFAHQQYDFHRNQTFCVEKDGAEIPGSRQGLNGNCNNFEQGKVPGE